MNSIPVTVFTGFLGAGKTTLLLSLLKKIPNDYRIALVKNEYGLTEVDSQLAQQSSLSSVTEILNGCLCCVLVGQLENAIKNALDAYNPHRILVETSGSAFPGPVAWQINEMRQKGINVHLDAIITVIDCENFCGYEDTSYTAKLQAQYSDLILLNKWDIVDERNLDLVIDHVNTLNVDTPKVKCSPDSISAELIFSVDKKLVDISNGILEDKNHMANEVQVKTVTSNHMMSRDLIEEALSSKRLSKDSFYRIKGYVRLDGNRIFLINWAFGRHDGLVEITKELGDIFPSNLTLKLSVMGNYFGNLTKIIHDIFKDETIRVY